MKAWRVIPVTLVIFGAGILTGLALSAWLNPGRESHGNGALLAGPEPESAPSLGLWPRPRVSGEAAGAPPATWNVKKTNFVAQLDYHLDLNAAQYDAIAGVLEENQKLTKELYDQISPRLRLTVRSTREQIRAILTPEQRSKYDDLVRNQNQKRRTSRTSPDPDTPAEAAPAP